MPEYESKNMFMPSGEMQWNSYKKMKSTKVQTLVGDACAG